MERQDEREEEELRSSWRSSLLHSPGLGGLRIAIGLAVAVHAAWFAAWYWGGMAPASAEDGESPAGVRPSMRDLVRGLGFVLDPDKMPDALKASAESGARAGEDAAPIPEGAADMGRLGSGSVDPGPIRQSPQQRLSCPSGYYLKGEICAPIESENKTPYQGLTDTARMMLIGAAVLAAIGLVLMTQCAGPLQILGGMLLGATLALALAAVAIGNQIGDEYGQKPQKEAVDGSASRAVEGRSP
ncbi:MAG: hypothetical protein WC728_15085 [Elusimicrobiota bacterium]